MGDYFNPGNQMMQESLNSEIYVDKSMLIAAVNKHIATRQKYLCVSRPRRFGKSMAMNMLAAYYSMGCDSHEQFRGLKISSEASYPEHLNKHHVIRINMQEYLTFASTMEELIANLTEDLLYEMLEEYHDLKYRKKDNLIQVMKDMYRQTKVQFIILIDEWDCIFREYREDKKAQEKYLDFLRAWLKDQEYAGLVYMTGILPIKKYGTHSALNMFTEYSMTDPKELAPYFGFTEAEVQALCQEYHRDFAELKAWYDGYCLRYMKNGQEQSYDMYNPKAVTESMYSGECNTYWNRTETYEALKIYIQMNYAGLKDDVIAILAGKAVKINIGTFGNDMTTFQSKDDILTLLIHLGYLSYDAADKTVRIPNKEVSIEYVNAISTMHWPEVSKAIQASETLLAALWAGDGDTVAAGVDSAHEEISILKYNDENSLSCTIGMAFYSAREYYQFIREMPAGKGFADIVLLPLQFHADKPAILIELKWDEEADTAIRQIHEKRYEGALQGYEGNILLAGISYDKAAKKHSCIIEKLE
ncbi:MAG: AAA family ATPase [Selenomonadaceae bacterium]|nr:AAA family ATPase [Selenomonadaceae bacterium]